jgi:hypothetical protein
MRNLPRFIICLSYISTLFIVLQNSSISKIIFDSTFTIGPSYRVLPSDSVSQTETNITVHPNNQNIIFSAFNTKVVNSYILGTSISTNGGINWYGTNAFAPFTNSAFDPAPIIDKNGVMLYIAISNTTGNFYGAVCSYSTNYGITWSDKIILQDRSSDKILAGTDYSMASPYYGRTYAVWSNYLTFPISASISYTTNSGISWSLPKQINTPVAGHYTAGCDLATGINGEVYVCWVSKTTSAPLIENYIAYTRSTNGGLNWNTTDTALDINGIQNSAFNGWGVRVNSNPRIAVDHSGGPFNGRVYIVTASYNQQPAGSDADIVLCYSSNSGTSWSSGIKVNQDPLNNGKVQFFPAICVDQYGGINVAFYDNRNYPSVGDSCQTFMARSTDGGESWNDFLVSDHAWLVKSEQGSPGYMGDYIGITATGDKIRPIWFDDKTGIHQAWTCEVSIKPIGITQISSIVPKTSKLKQNYPNPFNPSTTIEFNINKSGHVQISIFDINGRLIESLLNQNLAAGEYRIDYNTKKLSSGLYFYRLNVEDYIETKKMLLIK